MSSKVGGDAFHGSLRVVRLILGIPRWERASDHPSSFVALAFLNVLVECNDDRGINSSDDSSTSDINFVTFRQ